MELIKRLPREIINNRARYFGIFLCTNCNTEVKKRLDRGIGSRSCGCIPSGFKHGDNRRVSGKKLRLYATWNGMKDRCYNKNNKHSHIYGDKGVVVCNEWLDYLGFKKWALNNGYSENLTIDRIDNDGNYEPSNCRFITAAHNSHRANALKLTFAKAEEIRSIYKKGGVLQKELGEQFGVCSGTISEIITYKIWRIDYGESV